MDNLQNQKPVSSFKNKKVIKCFKQAPNLKKTLCKAAYNKNKKVGIFKCKKPRCTLCNNIQETEKISFKNFTKEFFIKSHINCDSKCVIYLLKCTGCEGEYIGQTTNLRNRMIVHRQHIKEKTLNTGLTKHIINCKDNTQKSFLLYPFYQCFNSEDLLAKEDYFIRKFTPNLNL